MRGVQVTQTQVYIRLCSSWLYDLGMVLKTLILVKAKHLVSAWEMLVNAAILLLIVIIGHRNSHSTLHDRFSFSGPSYPTQSL